MAGVKVPALMAPIPLAALAAIAGVTTAVAHSGGLPFFELGVLFDAGPISLQWFGLIVASGVLLGASLARKYAERRGVHDDDMRAVTAWVVVTGFIGAHVFDVVAYEWDRLEKDPLLLLRLWEGISSYGGFIGGALGWSFYVWWKRLSWGLWADTTIVGLLPGFTIGRIGCTVVHDHIGRPTDLWTGTDYPRAEVVARLCDKEGCPDWVMELPGQVHRLHNLGMYELAYLIPVNVLILGLAFSKKRTPAGLLAILTGALYAPVRFFLEYMRPNETDPRYVGLTFAQWSSILAFAVAIYALVRVLRHGKPAPLAEELGPKEVGGRRTVGPRLSGKDLKELEKAPGTKKD